MSEKPAWLIEAERYIGVREIKGPQHEPLIVKWWKAIRRGGIRDDETPWCAAFVGACLEAVGLRSTEFEGAQSYAGWGKPLASPVPGCVVVLSREGGGHVGFVVARTPGGALLVLGGNQSDQVNVSAFPRHRVIAYRWPLAVTVPAGDLPVWNSAGFGWSASES